MNDAVIEKGQKFEGNDQLIWDASSLSSIQSCPRKYKYSVIEKLIPAGWDTGVKKDWGHAVHAGLEAADHAIHDGADKEEAVQLGILALEPYKDILLDPRLLIGTDKSDGRKRNMYTAIRAIVNYYDVWTDNDRKTVTLPNGKAAIEVRFEVPFMGSRLSGRIDRLVDVEDEGLYISDRKTTTATLGPRFFEWHWPSDQVYAYIYALRYILGIPVLGFEIDAISTLVGGTHFERRIFEVSDEQLEEWAENIKNTVDQAKKYAELDFWPTNFQGCSAYGGCIYRRVCTKSPQFRDTFLEEQYKRREDDRSEPTGESVTISS